MKKILTLLMIPVVAIVLASTLAFASGKEAEKVESATEALEEIMAIPETGIPPSLLRDAHGIAIIPSVIK
ncbi:MAG: Ysc84 protein, partial [Actinobacteria bacterium]|nr:Ysc84 protein [Actinomycetota bacterium]